MKEMLKDIYFKSIWRKIKRLENEYKDFIFIFTFAGIGDLCYSFAFLEELKKREKKKIMVFTKRYLYRAVSYYEAVDIVKILSDRDSVFVESFLKAKRNWKYFNDGVNGSPFYYFSHWNRFGWEILRIPNVNYMDVQRYILYNFDDTAELTLPAVPDISLERFDDIDYKRTIIINPYSNFLKITDSRIFDTLTDYLSLQGFIVYTNTTKNQTALKGSRRLECSLEELYGLCKRVKLVVSLRSGIIDLMIHSGGNFIVLYSDETYWDKIFRQAYTLTAWRTKNKIYEYLLKEEDEIMLKAEEIMVN